MCVMVSGVVVHYNRRMAKLIIVNGPQTGREIVLGPQLQVIGRVSEAAIQLPSQNVSRRHAQIRCEAEGFFIEDLGSVNGTLLNGQRLHGDSPLTDGDELRIAEFVLAYRAETGTESAADVLEEVAVAASNLALFAEKPEQKLQTVLLLAQHLGQALDSDALLGKLLQHLLHLFPLADRGLVVLCEGGRFVVRAQQTRRRGDDDFSYSRTVIRKAIEGGRGILSLDVRTDEQFNASSTICATGAVSLLCVPLLGHDGKALGAIQLDCVQAGRAFTGEHLRLLTTMCLLAAVALENVVLNTVRAREESLRRDLALGREIQLGFLPTDFSLPPESGCEVFANIHPAKEVSGDLYDFFPLADGRLTFLVGDVSDKGIPAAMFMVKVQTLVRHLMPVTDGPAEALRRLNDALAVNNPSSMFVTLTLGVYDPRTGEMVLASGGHPRPLLRHPDGKADELAMPVGRLLGCFEGDPGGPDVLCTLNPGQTLILYSDGYTEAAAPGTRAMFGVERLKEVFGGPQTALPLAGSAAAARQAVEHHIGGNDYQDDLTLLLLRRT